MRRSQRVVPICCSCRVRLFSVAWSLLTREAAWRARLVTARLGIGLRLLVGRQ